MSQQPVLQSAQAGDPNAIALLLNQALKARQVRAHLRVENHHLYITLESETVPDPAASMRLIHKGMLRLQPQSISEVTVMGRPDTQESVAWIQTLVLQSPPPATIPAEVPTAQPPKTAPKPTRKRKSKKTAKKTAPTPSRLPQPPQTAPRSPAPPAQRKFRPLAVVGAIGIAVLPISSFAIGAGWDRVSASLAALPPTLSTAFSQLPELPDFSFSQSAQMNPFAAEDVPTRDTVETLTRLSELTLSSLENPIDPDTRISIKAVGDIIPGTNYPSNKLHPQKQVLFQSVKPALQGADIVFGNFESTLTNYPNSAKNVGRGLVFAFRTPPEYTEILKEAGFDVLSVANNHSFDFFETGFEETIANIEKAGMKAVGKKDQIVYHEVKGVQTAFVGFSYFDIHNNMNDLEASQALIAEAAENAAIVVVSVHAGAEGTAALNIDNKTEYFYGENRGNKVLFARSMIDAGADLVLGHGPHVPRALELYDGKLIAYSLGNFMGYRTLSTRAQLGYSLVLEAQLDPVGNFVEGKIIPVHLNSQGIPYLDHSFRSVGLIRSLTKNNFPETQLEIDGEGKILISEPES
ncbi:MAG: CapA family protein [Limnospira sp.]